MFYVPEPEEVLCDMGEKSVYAMSRSVALGRDDLADLRRIRPRWVATSSERGLANFIHDRIWDHLLGQVDDIPEVSIVDREPTREMFVRTKYRLRVKRHHLDGQVSSYPTQTALDFFGQGGTLPIPTLEEINLIVGYEWDRDERAMGGPLLSLRNGRDNILWIHPLPAIDERDGDGPDLPPVVPGPTDPIVELPGIDMRRRRSAEQEQE